MSNKSAISRLSHTRLHSLQSPSSPVPAIHGDSAGCSLPSPALRCPCPWMPKKVFFNYFKKIPEDLLVNSPTGILASIVGTLVLTALFLLEINAYLSVSTQTDLVVDELPDKLLRINFNVTLHEVPCEYLSVDVADYASGNTHNITKDILKFRLDQKQRPVAFHGAMQAAETKNAVAAAARQVANKVGLSGSKMLVADNPGPQDIEDEELDANLSFPLNPEIFGPFMEEHELTLVNFYAPWCIWCQRLKPTYLKAASKMPDMGFHGHARMAQVDCVEHNTFCRQQQIRAYPTLRMYKDGNPTAWAQFTGERTETALLKFISEQMENYKHDHATQRIHHNAKFDQVAGALIGDELYRAKMTILSAHTFCGQNAKCTGFTWSMTETEEEPLIYFKTEGGEKKDTNKDPQWKSFVKLAGAHVSSDSKVGSVEIGAEGCLVVGHLKVRKVPGALKFVINSPDHDHALSDFNASHIINDFWFGEPLTIAERRRMPTADLAELNAPTSHQMRRSPFISYASSNSHVHYLQVVTKVLKHLDAALSDTILYKYTVHSNLYHSEKAAGDDETPPAVMFRYDLSPVSIVINQVRQPFYRFITSLCAIIGGVYTVIQLFEGVLHHTTEKLLKKQA